MPFQMPQIQNNIGNALANVAQLRQQRMQNALAEREFAQRDEQLNAQRQLAERQFGLSERQLGLSEAEGRRQQEQFDAERASAQRAQLVETTKNVIGALARLPQEQRQAAFAQFASELPPELAQRMAGNPEAFTDQNIALALNRFGSLTPDQIFGDLRRKTEAEAKPESIVTYGRDGRPLVRLINPYSSEAQQGIVQAPDANTNLTQATSRANNEATNATSRANNRDTNATSRANNRDSNATSAANAARNAGAGGMTAAQRANVQNKLQSVRLVQAQLKRAQEAFKVIQGSMFQAGPGTQFNPLANGGQRFDAIARGLQQTIRQLTRTPGEGAMSDYESRLAAAIVPERGDLEGTTAARLEELQNIVNDIEAGYTNMAMPNTGGATGGWGKAEVESN